MIKYERPGQFICSLCCSLKLHMDDKVPFPSSIMTPPEVAQLLRISRASVYRLIERRALPFYKIGGSLRFSRSAVLKYLEEVTVSSSNPYHYDCTKKK